MADIISQVQASENQLFSLLSQGNYQGALAMHNNTPTYQNILNGSVRTYADMQALIATLSGGDPCFPRPSTFLIINDTNVLETIQSNGTIIGDPTKGTYQIAISILWNANGDTTWNVAYMHTSYQPLQK